MYNGGVIHRKGKRVKLWQCDDCGWLWPLPDEPPEDAECDNCGGELMETVGA